MHQQITLEKKFRPEIEGLRIVAALLVAVYHIWLGRVSGGVDVFFVISGFLITTSIVSRYNRTGEFRFLPYIMNLLKRLLPSVIVVISAVIMLSIFFLPRSIAEKTFDETIASLFYFQNWQLALSNTDYLDREQMKTPLEHFWAMSIQGQFYIIWFLLFTLVFFILKKKARWNGVKLLNMVLGSLFILSLGYSIYLTEVNQPWAYFDVSTRVWEFSLGGLLAVNLSRIKITGLMGDILGWLGLAGLLLTGIIFDVSTMFPGYIALWPMLCAAAILISGNMETRFGVKSFLGSKWMMTAGGLAFGLYLWHWVLLSFYQYHNPETPGLLTGLGIIGLSFMLSWLVTRYVEQPIRSMDIGVKPILLLSIGLITNLLIAGGIYYYHQASVPSTDDDFNFNEYPGAWAIQQNMDIETNPDDYLPTVAEAKEDMADSYDDGVHQTRTQGALKVGEYGVTEDHDHTIALVGSSHSAHWLGALQQFADEENIRIINMTQLGSRFSTKHTSGPQKEWNDNAIKYLQDHKEEIDLVVATADVGLADYPEPPEGMVEQLNRIGDDIGIPVMAIRDNQRFGFNIVEHLEQYGYEETRKKMAEIEPIAETAPWDRVEYKSPNVHPVDYTEYFMVDGEYEPIIGNVLIYYDGGHINNTYATTMGPVLKEDVMRIMEE
ncbi:acyltransferase family protein [Salinicoccus roseus]|uniref:Acyltransferase n=1 Tax=Salinicoccus roseus TaxID=45670 RepID=A0A265E633_9STAP|nr:acyltransferase family protein [Salinicoccus roseus]OZT76896.1 acyltransferase [Salinicoccus roseus]